MYSVVHPYRQASLSVKVFYFIYAIAYETQRADTQLNVHWTD